MTDMSQITWGVLIEPLWSVEDWREPLMFYPLNEEVLDLYIMLGEAFSLV